MCFEVVLDYFASLFSSLHHLPCCFTRWHYEVLQNYRILFLITCHHQHINLLSLELQKLLLPCTFQRLPQEGAKNLCKTSRLVILYWLNIRSLLYGNQTHLNQQFLNLYGMSDIKSQISQPSWDEYKSVPRASLREATETREWTHRRLILIFKVRRRTGCGVSHQSLSEMCENLWLSHKAGKSFCHTLNNMLKGLYKSIHLTQNNGASFILLFLFALHMHFFL